MSNSPILTEKDIDYLEERFKEVFTTKDDFIKYKSDLMDKLDKILKEIQASREEQTILAHHSKNHGDRITKLESVCSLH